MIRKPPIGLSPAFIYIEDRMLEIQRAVNRYMAEGLNVPVSWIEEYNKLATLK